MSSSTLELVTVEPEVCCGTETCTHTEIEHNGHTGWLVDGKLRCRKSDYDPFFDCTLSFDNSEKCEVVPVLEGHAHGPNCGHEMVPHGDHHDYLVGSRLHHVVERAKKCCTKACLGNVLESIVVDHGGVKVKNRPKSARSSIEMDSLIKEVVCTEIYAAGICCPSETSLIQRILGKLPGVMSVDIVMITKTVVVKHDAKQCSPAVLVSALNGAGLQAALGKRQLQKDTKTETLPVYVILSGILLAISLGHFISGFEWLKYVALGSVLFGCPHILKRCFASIRRGLLDINVLTISAVVGAIALQEYLEAGAVVFLFGLAQWLEDNCMGRARNAISTLRELQPEFALTAQGDELIAVDKIVLDDLLVVRPGDRVAVDGVVIDGSSTLDESMLTGESQPVMKAAGDSVYSGSVNCGNGSITIKATSTVSDSTVSFLAKKVEEAAMTKSSTDRAVERFAKFYTPLVVFIAIGVALVPLALHDSKWKEWLMLSLILLVTACPCALVISTPVCSICGISSAATRSILIKGGTALENLSRLKGITFDKTGTLSQGHFEVVSINTFTSMTEDEVLRLAAALEIHSSHPLAASIVGASAARSFTRNTLEFAVQNIPGGGLIGRTDRSIAAVGNLALLIDKGFEFENPFEAEQKEESLSEQGKKGCFVGLDGLVVGLIIMEDSVREKAQTAVKSLRDMKLKVGVLTGDGPAAAQHVAATVGIPSSRVFSKLLPEQKSTILRGLREDFGRIGHVGDGVNDSIALAAADVGIAMGIGGSTMAVEAADVALFSNDLDSVPIAIRISRKVRFIIYENILFAIAVKVVMLILALYGITGLWEAVAADVGSSLVVVLNGLRILDKPSNSSNVHQHGKKSCCPAEKYGIKDNDGQTSLQIIPLKSDCGSAKKDHSSCCGSKTHTVTKPASFSFKTQAPKTSGCGTHKTEPSKKAGCCSSKGKTPVKLKCCENHEEDVLH